MICKICGSKYMVSKHHFWHDEDGKGINHAPELCAKYRVPVAYVYLCEVCHNKYEGYPLDFFLNKLKRQESLFMAENNTDGCVPSGNNPVEYHLPILVPIPDNYDLKTYQPLGYIKPRFNICMQCGNSFIPNDYMINTFCGEFCGSQLDKIRQVKLRM